MEKEQKVLPQVELCDLLENTGILQEVNRTFFNPLSLNLKLNEDLTLSLETTNKPEGFIFNIIDKFKLKTFNDYRRTKHTTRNEKAGFIIQTQDMIRKDKLEVPITPPSSLKLRALLIELDNFVFEIKKRLMEKSKDKDEDLSNLNIVHLGFKTNEAIHKNNFIDATASLMMVSRVNYINKRLKEIREIDKKQKEVYKGDK